MPIRRADDHPLSERLESNAYSLVGASAEELAFRIDIARGRKHINKFGIEALANLIALAEAVCRYGAETKMPPEGGI